LKKLFFLSPRAMQAIQPEDTAGTKGQFGYGAVVEDGSTANAHEPQEALQKSKRFKLGLGLLALILVGTGIALVVVFWHHEKTPAEQFEEYKLKFSKQYTTEEAVTAFKAFAENIKEIKKLNEGKTGAVFGWNRFTDLDMSEFRSRYLGRDPPTESQRASIKAAPSVSSGPSVTKLDWTEEGIVPPIRDQGACGSCWAYSVVAPVESAYIRKNGLSGDDVENFELSVQQMVSCDSDGWNAGCNGGDPPGAFDWLKDNGGLAHATDYPYSSYEGDTGSCTDGVSVVDGTDADWGYATDACFSSRCSDLDEEKMAESVETYGVITVCVNASWWQFYSGGVMTADDCGNSGYWALNHCVALTGFDLDADTPYWILRNSWATDWGEEGYMRVEYGTNTCGVADEAIYAEL